jgi:hypothetical protein
MKLVHFREGPSLIGFHGRQGEIVSQRWKIGRMEEWTIKLSPDGLAQNKASVAGCEGPQLQVRNDHEGFDHESGGRSGPSAPC